MIKINTLYYDEKCTTNNSRFAVLDSKPSKYDDTDKEGIITPLGIPLEFTTVDEKRYGAWSVKTSEEIHRIKQQSVRSYR
jgi:hypothetical protein